MKVIPIYLIAAVGSACAQITSGDATSQKMVELKNKALEGDSESAFKLSVVLSVSGKKEAGSQWLKIASDLGHPVAQYNLALDLLNDPSTEPEGYMLLQMSSKSGYKMAEQKILEMKKKRLEPNSLNGTNELEKKVLLGDSFAAFRLFEIYSGFNGMENNASRWLRKAADMGNTDALYTLGVRWRDHPSLPNKEYARYYFEKAASKGHKLAIEALKTL
jgi:TPR repeat protein